MFFNGWGPILHVLVLGPLGYLGLVVLLRVSGKRTLSKMNAFDFVITIALGSTFATSLLSSEVSLVAALTAFAVLISLQYVVSFVSVRWPAFEGLVKAQPTLVYHDGRFLEDALRRARVTKAEVHAAIREHGRASLERVRAVVLETDSSISVITSGDAKPSSLSDVHGFR